MSDSSPSRWPRFIPRQFSIGALLLLITIVACFLSWYRRLPEGAIREHQAKQVIIGMTEEEVKSLLGKPSYVKPHSSNATGFYWQYIVAPYLGDELRRLSIQFDGTPLRVIEFHQVILSPIAEP